MSLFRLDASIRVEGFPQPRHRRHRRAGVAERPPRRVCRPPSRRGRSDPDHCVGDRRFRRLHARGVAHGRAADRAGARRDPDRRAQRGRCAAVRRAALQLRGVAALQDLGRHGHHRPAHGRGHAAILAGKPAVLVTVRGGNYRPGTSREGWDHATGWMRRILADVWNLDLKVVEAEFTTVGVNPALDRFKDLARQLRREAEEQARRHGRELGVAVGTASPKAA